MKKFFVIAAACLVLASTGCRPHRDHFNDRDYRHENMDPNRPPMDRPPMDRPPMGQEYDNVRGLQRMNVRNDNIYESNGVYYRQVNNGGQKRYRVVGYRDNDRR